MCLTPYITKSELNIALYIAQNVKLKDFHNIFKILFWSDREHLVVYGQKLSDDIYVVMPKGPVPTNLYNYFQSIRDSKDTYFQIDNFIVKPLTNPDADYISESEKECIDKIISKYDNMEFGHRTDLSHGFAYNNAIKRHKRFIEDGDIACEGGANEELIRFINTSL